MRRPLLLLLAVLLLGGCTVSVDRTDRRSDVAERWERDQRVELDLSEPPTRQEAGLAEGRTTLALERRPPDVLDVRLALPEGGTLRVPAVSVVVDAMRGDQPDSLAVARLEPFAEGVEVLREDVRRLGLDEAALQRFLDAAAGPGGLAGNANAPLGEVTRGYLRIALEARQLREDDVLQINYDLSWDTAGTTG